MPTKPLALIEKTWHGGAKLKHREDYLAALIDELLMELCHHHGKEIIEQEGQFVCGKALTDHHPVERALRALAVQVKTRPKNKRISTPIMKALFCRGLVEP